MTKLWELFPSTIFLLLVRKSSRFSLGWKRLFFQSFALPLAQMVRRKGRLHSTTVHSSSGEEEGI